jgi:SAM-dependent methyltransferase
VSEAEAFLLDWHARHTGGSSRLLRQGLLDDGRTGYELLAGVVPEGAEGVAIVDLGCGDGELLAHLVDRVGPDCRLVGVDISMAELAAASARPELRCCHLVLEPAQDLTLPPRMVDFVLSHMALMLMDDVDAVMKGVARVLKRGGLFSALLGMRPLLTDGWRAFSDAFSEAGPARCLELGDERTRSAEGLRSLFGHVFEDITIREPGLDLGGTPEQVWERMAGNYLPALLDDAGRERLRRGFFERTGGRERLELRFELLQVTARLVGT